MERQVNLLKYPKIGKKDLIVIIHPKVENAINIIKKIKSGYNFHLGDIFSVNPAKYQGTFEQKCKPITDCTSAYLEDVALRQGVEFTSEISPTERQYLSQIRDDDKKKFLKIIEPLHFLPKRIFGNTMSNKLLRNINHFIITPESYLIFHHPNEEKKFWNQKWMKKCLFELKDEHGLLKIISVSSAKLLPSKHLTECNFLFLFNKEESDLKDVYRRAQLNKVIEKNKSLIELADSLPASGGIVVQRSFTPVQDTDGNAKMMEFCELAYTTDVVRKHK